MKMLEPFAYRLPGGQKPLTFEPSDRGFIDSARYSLLEVLHDPRLQALSLEQRVEIMNSYLDDMKAGNHFSYLRELTTGCETTVQMKEPGSGEIRTMLNFSSNDYLNLSQHPRVKKAAAEAVREFGLGSGSTSMFTGNMALHKKLEQRIAAFKGCEDAMLFASGYATNFSVIRALLGENDAAICDTYAHASLMDGCTHAKRYLFKHNDVKSLENNLQKASAHKNKLVILDGVYSMDGDIARLDEIADLAHQYGAWVLVDDAHATGVIGEQGKGTPTYFNIPGKVDLITDTFSKALGAIGGYVAGKKELISYLRVASRGYMFATSPAIPVMAGVLEALDILQEEPQLLKDLHHNIRYFSSRIVEMGFQIGASETAIIPLIIGNDFNVKEMTHRLHRAGILANAVPYPAVPKKLTRVRITLTAGHTQKQLDYALQEIKRIRTEMGLIPGKNGPEHKPNPQNRSLTDTRLIIPDAIPN